jgi:hypothetical protein
VRSRNARGVLSAGAEASNYSKERKFGHVGGFSPRSAFTRLRANLPRELAEPPSPLGSTSATERTFE